MKSTVVTIQEAKANLSRLLIRAENGEDIVIARASKPVAKLVPIGTIMGERVPGALKGEFQVGQDFFDPLPQEEQAAWEIE